MHASFLARLTVRIRLPTSLHPLFNITNNLTFDTGFEAAAVFASNPGFEIFPTKQKLYEVYLAFFKHEM